MTPQPDRVAQVVAWLRAMPWPDTTQDDELVERVARIIDPTSFRYHESMFSYCLAQGDDDSTAERYADETHGPSIEAARKKARAVIRALAAKEVE